MFITCFLFFLTILLFWFIVYQHGFTVGIRSVGQFVEKLCCILVLQIGCRKSHVFSYALKRFMCFFIHIVLFIG